MSRKPRKRDPTENRWSDIDGGMAFTIPYTLLRHPNTKQLSPWAVKLLFDLSRQYTGFNNGWLCATFSLMKDAGWRSDHTVRKAAKELMHYALIQQTQKGGRNRPNLYALTWRRIDGKKDRFLDVLPTLSPSNDWKVERPTFVRTTGKRKIQKPKDGPLKAA